MDFDQLLLRAFGTSDLSGLPHDRLLAGVETLRAQFDAADDGDNDGDGGDSDERFALWCLLYMLGAAPDLEDAFDDDDDREAARDFMTSIDEDEEDEEEDGDEDGQGDGGHVGKA